MKIKKIILCIIAGECLGALLILGVLIYTGNLGEENKPEIKKQVSEKIVVNAKYIEKEFQVLSESLRVWHERLTSRWLKEKVTLCSVQAQLIKAYEKLREVSAENTKLKILLERERSKK